MSEQYVCALCGCVSLDSEWLVAPSPFDNEEEIVGCPECAAVNSAEDVCCVPLCNRPGDVAWTDAPNQDYRPFCDTHNPTKLKVPVVTHRYEGEA